MDNYKKCTEILYRFIGTSIVGYNGTTEPLILPAGGSIQQLDHLLQIHKSRDFSTYSYGTDENYRLYGKPDPNLYNLSLITAPIVIFFGGHDHLSSTPDNHFLYQKLPSTIGLYTVFDHKFNHFDFMVGRNAQIFLYSKIMDTLSKFMDGTLNYTIEWFFEIQ